MLSPCTICQCYLTLYISEINFFDAVDQHPAFSECPKVQHCKGKFIMSENSPEVSTPTETLISIGDSNLPEEHIDINVPHGGRRRRRRHRNSSRRSRHQKTIQRFGTAHIILGVICVTLQVQLSYLFVQLAGCLFQFHDADDPFYKQQYFVRIATWFMEWNIFRYHRVSLSWSCQNFRTLQVNNVVPIK